MLVNLLVFEIVAWLKIEWDKSLKLFYLGGNVYGCTRLSEAEGLVLAQCGLIDENFVPECRLNDGNGEMRSLVLII